MDNSLIATIARQQQSEELGQLDLHAGFGEGIEADATMFELRLALHEYRNRHGREYWRLFVATAGRA